MGLSRTRHGELRGARDCLARRYVVKTHLWGPFVCSFGAYESTAPHLHSGALCVYAEGDDRVRRGEFNVQKT
jgi:hypothetical protein